MAQVFTTDLGIHNANLEATNARLTKDGCWKKQRIVYVIPGGSMIPAKVYVSHRGLIFPPNQAMIPLYVEGAEVGAAYEAALDIILGNPNLREFEYVLTIEHDNIPSPTGVLDLLRGMEEHPEFAVMSGLYFTKGPGGVAQVWGDARDPVVNYRPVPPEPEKVMECWGTGMGFALWRMSMFRDLEAKKVARPWFKTLSGNDGTGLGTQDLVFWGRVGKPNGYRCAVDCRVRVGHYDHSTGLVW